MLQVFCLLRDPVLRKRWLMQAIMGVIVLAQPHFLKFEMENSTSSGVACFITGIIELVIFVSILIYERKDAEANATRENYINLESERNERPRQSTFKGIALMDMDSEGRQRYQ